jgi:hypothetical protein
MKKAIALLAALVVISTTAFAQLAPSISGSAETKWGMNLDDETNGFETSASVTVTVPLTAVKLKLLKMEKVLQAQLQFLEQN